MTEENSIYIKDNDSLFKTAKPIPNLGPNLTVDTNNIFEQNLIDTIDTSIIDISKIESLTQLSQNRNSVYDMLDSMAEDSTIAAALEIYAEDTTETNQEGRIVWCESDSAEIQKYISYLLDSLDIEKNIYKWAYTLCKYGDLYLRLYRESDYKDSLFDSEVNPHAEENKQHLSEAVGDELNEAVKIIANKKYDHYSHFVEMMPNPAEIFELTKLGKTYAYIKAPFAVLNSPAQFGLNALVGTNYLTYSFKQHDIEVYRPTEFVHATLEDVNTRIPETVEIFRGDNSEETAKLSYSVKRGQSILTSVYKIWREMMLLENSLMLNRITKSSLLRIVQIELGNTGRSDAQETVQRLKSMIEQKSALNTGQSLNEYTNPGPIENTIYVPTYNGKGAISVNSIGDDANVKDIADIDYFRDKLFGALKIPKQFLAYTDDNTGFNGGTSLSLISSRYAKAIKRVQNAIIQMIEDLINLFLLDKGLDRYINRFVIKMTTPTTQELKDRIDMQSSLLNNVRDIVDLTSTINSDATKLKIVKNLVAPIVNDGDILQLLQDEIDILENNSEAELEEPALPTNDLDISDDLIDDTLANNDFSDNDTSSPEISDASKLPTPAELDKSVDFTQNI